MGKADKASNSQEANRERRSSSSSSSSSSSMLLSCNGLSLMQYIFSFFHAAKGTASLIDPVVILPNGPKTHLR
ncbi:hypothetical protein BHE74_00017849 [Ensete ventricosum]|nr:hypothetical protein BHE74_00017849 [Ensete ventricosum]